MLSLIFFLLFPLSLMFHGLFGFFLLSNVYFRIWTSGWLTNSGMSLMLGVLRASLPLRQPPEDQLC